MKLRDCVLLLPSSELDSFPRTLPSAAARDLLSGWIALWHPQLLAGIEAAPRLQAATQLPGELHDILFVLPALSDDKIDDAAEQRIAAAGAHLLRPCQTSWRSFQDELLRVSTTAGLLQPECPQPSTADEVSDHDTHRIQPPTVDQTTCSPAELSEEMRDDFAALGYAFLQIQLMTRQLRYSSNLDLLQFGQQLTSAARASLTGDRTEAERWLQACFDALGQERDHYFSLDVHLLDITLLAATTLGKSLASQLATNSLEHAAPTAYLASGQLLRELSVAHPHRLSELQTVVKERRACLVGGLDVERPHLLLTREAIARDFARGREAYRAYGFESPRVFARHSYGLTADSVTMLRRWGFEACLLISWSEGNYPQGAQPKISWEASDGTFLSTLAANVLDSSDPNSYLALGWKLGDALEHQHVPTVVFAHWPNQCCEFADLLVRVCRRTPALGKWKLVDDYFSDTDQPYHQERLSGSAFRYNWLTPTTKEPQESPAPNRWAAHLRTATQLAHHLQSRCRSLQNLLNVAWQLEHFHRRGDSSNNVVTAADQGADTYQAQESTESSASHSGDRAKHRSMELSSWSPELAELVEQVDRLLDDPQQASAQAARANALADQLRAATLERLGRLLHADKGRAATGSSAVHLGRLLVNPRSSPVRVATHTLPDQHLAPGVNWNYAQGRVGEGRVTCVDIPPHGFVVTPVSASQHRTTSKQRPLADGGGLLSNEFLELQIDPARGHLRSLHVPAKRGNRLSVMIARREQTPADSKRPPSTAAGAPRVSEMVATNFQMLTSSNICGVIRSEGHLQFDGKKVAHFRMDYEVWRGSRIVDINIHLHDLQPLSSDNPWHSAYVLRLAWPTDAAVLRTFPTGYRHTWGTGRGISPTLVEIDEVDYRTHFLTGGLAFHRRSELRFLETVLASAGEAEVHHRIGIGVDLPHPQLAAEQFLDTSYELPLQRSQPVAPSSGWLVSVDTRNVAVHLESPLVDDQQQLVGIRLFISELEGKATSTQVRLLREIDSAQRVDYLGGKISQVTAQGDRLTVALRAHEQVNVDVLWKR